MDFQDILQWVVTHAGSLEWTLSCWHTSLSLVEFLTCRVSSWEVYLGTWQPWRFGIFFQIRWFRLTSHPHEWLLGPENFLKGFTRWLHVWIFKLKAMLLWPRCMDHPVRILTWPVDRGLSIEGIVKLCSEPESSASASHVGQEFLPSLCSVSFLNRKAEITFTSEEQLWPPLLP